MTLLVDNVPDCAPHLDPRLFRDDQVPELVRELLLRIAREDEIPTSRVTS